MQEYTWEEVEKHNSEESLWIVVSGKVYDVTKFLKDHPGGEGPFKWFAGKDATQKFGTIDAHLNSKTLPDFMETLCIGTVPKKDLESTET